MKTIYVCDKSGKSFSGDNAVSLVYACEESHDTTGSIVSPWDLHSDNSDELSSEIMHFNEGCERPDLIALKFPVRVEGEVRTDENGNTLYDVVRYKIVLPSKDTPTVCNRIAASLLREQQRWAELSRAREARLAAQKAAESDTASEAE